MTETEQRNMALVLTAFDTLFNKRDYVSAQRFWSPHYIQHSAHIAPGREGLFELVQASPPDMHYENALITANGEYVMLHGRFCNVGQPAHWIVADIVRVEDGLLAEHWDVIQDEATAAESQSLGCPCSATPSPHGSDTECTSTTNHELEDQLMSRLNGKVAVITGGSSGIGLATAQRFVAEGAYVFIMGRRQSELDKAKALIGDGLTTVAGDVTNRADLDRLFATVLHKEGGLDILVASSGRAEPEELGSITEENFDRTFELNARATLFTVQKALPLIRNGGSVILVGSIAGYVGVPGYSTYSATKAALRSYTRTWTRESNGRGIRFNTLSPGPIDTPILDGQADSVEAANELKAQFIAAVPLNRLGRPDEIAAAALFLASDDSSFVAGAELSVDGGMAQV